MNFIHKICHDRSISCVLLVLSSILLLIVGAGIYFYYRIPIFVFQELNIPQEYRFHLNTHNPLVYFTIFCLPDALWYISLLLIETIFLPLMSIFSKLSFIIALSLPFILEILQYFSIISGTFDVCDIRTYCLTFIIYLLCIKRKLSLLH